MKQLVRVLGVAVLAVALLDASAGLCFCHRGAARPGASPASHGCCHGPDSPGGQPVVKAVSSCCHIESAESAAVPSAAVQIAPPAAVVTAIAAATPAFETFPSVAGALPGSSPPIFVLRI